MDSNPRSHAHTVLVVADDMDMREAYAVMLRHAQIEAAMVGGADAVERLDEGLRPCVILLDFNTPLNAAALRRCLKDTPEYEAMAVVLVTHGREPVPPLHGNGHLRGPVDTDSLRGAIEKYCSN